MYKKIAHDTVKTRAFYLPLNDSVQLATLSKASDYRMNTLGIDISCLDHHLIYSLVWISSAAYASWKHWKGDEIMDNCIMAPIPLLVFELVVSGFNMKGIWPKTPCDDKPDKIQFEVCIKQNRLIFVFDT